MSDSGEAGDADDLFARFLEASRAFLRLPSLAAMRVLTGRYTLFYVARHGSDRGLEPYLETIERNCRNILNGQP